MSEIVHFAGPVMTFGSVSRQRCAWCGALIQEYDLRRVAVEESSRPPERRGKPLDVDELGWWEKCLVAVDGPAKWRVDEPEDGKAPDRSCMQLLPDEVLA